MPHSKDTPWDRLREQFLLDPGIVYLNTGTPGACPRAVVEAHADLLRRLESNPAMLHFGELGRQVEGVRRQATAFLSADPDEIVLTGSTAEGRNMVAAGLDLQPGDEALMSTEEHPGGRAGWEYLARRRGIRLRQVVMPRPARDAEQIVETLRAGIGSRTRVLSLSHVNTITGLRLPVGSGGAPGARARALPGDRPRPGTRDAGGGRPCPRLRRLRLFRFVTALRAAIRA